MRQLAKLACPLLTRLVLHHNQIAEVQYVIINGYTILCFEAVIKYIKYIDSIMYCTYMYK